MKSLCLYLSDVTSPPVSTFSTSRGATTSLPNGALIRKKTFPYARSESSRTASHSFSQRLLADLEIDKHIRNSNVCATLAITSNKPCDMRDMPDECKQFFEVASAGCREIDESISLKAFPIFPLRVTACSRGRWRCRTTRQAGERDASRRKEEDYVFPRRNAC